MNRFEQLLCTFTCHKDNRPSRVGEWYCVRERGIFIGYFDSNDKAQEYIDYCLNMELKKISPQSKGMQEVWIEAIPLNNKNIESRGFNYSNPIQMGKDILQWATSLPSNTYTLNVYNNIGKLPDEVIEVIRMLGVRYDWHRFT